MPTFVFPHFDLAAVDVRQADLQKVTLRHRVPDLVDQAQAYAVGLAEQFVMNYKKMGGTISTEQTYTGGATDFTAQLTSIRSSKPDVVYIPGYYTDVANIALQARKLGITAPLLGGDGWDSEQLAKIGKDAIEGCYYTNHYAPDQPDAAVQTFIKSYKKEFGGSTPDGLAALGYDAANILFEAMRKAKTPGGRDLRNAIADTKDFAGVTGKITINSNRDATKSAVVVEMAGDPPAPKYVTTVSPELVISRTSSATPASSTRRFAPSTRMRRVGSRSRQLACSSTDLGLAWR